MALKKSHFKFNKQERSGIFFLLLLIVLVQIVFWLYSRLKVNGNEPIILNYEVQSKIDSLKSRQTQKDSIKIYPFNPNFITDYKGYTLGLSLDEIDRLHEFREQGKFVNSKEEFQQVTGVSDSLLNKISKSFKFSEWTKSAKIKGQEDFVSNAVSKKEISYTSIGDLNSVTAQELKLIKGIGDKLSERIVKFRDRLGGFLINDQLNDVYGLDPRVAQRVLQRYKVLKAPQVQKIDLETATVGELAKLVYIPRSVAENIVAYRELNGGIDSFDELLQIENFPADRIDRIPLYLSIKK